MNDVEHTFFDRQYAKFVNALKLQSIRHNRAWRARRRLPILLQSALTG